jgi:NDP-sugar pyrophosphorylase family protein
MKAMIYSAGLGTRLGDLTSKCPKAMVPLQDKPLLYWAILRLKRFGFDQIIVNVHHFGEQIIEYIKQTDIEGVDIAISDEREQLLMTGGGLKKARWFFDDQPFIVHNVDVISQIDLVKLYNTHAESGALATVAVSKRETSRYLLFNSSNKLCGWMNRASGETRPKGIKIGDYSRMAFSGIHVISPGIFDLFFEEEAFTIIDVYLKLMLDHDILGYEHDASTWQDIGKPNELAAAEITFKPASYI